MFYGKSKYISIKFHNIRQAMKNSRIELKFCSSEEQVIDTFIKLSNWLCTTSPRQCLVWLTLKLRLRNIVENINMISIEIKLEEF